MVKKTLGQRLADKRVPDSPFKGLSRRLTPKEAGIARAHGRKSRPRDPSKPRHPKPRQTIKVGGQTRYAKRRKDGTFQDIQDPKLARSRDRQKHNVGKTATGADRGKKKADLDLDIGIPKIPKSKKGPC